MNGIEKPMTIYETRDKRALLPLLLLADESERMIARYLERGTMFVLDDGGIRAEAVVCDEGGGTVEIKNIAVFPEFRRRGYGRALIDFVCARYALPPASASHIRARSEILRQKII